MSRFRQPNRRRRSYGGKRSGLRRALDAAVTLLIFASLALVVARIDRFSVQQLAGQTRVGDGDSLEIDGERLRLKGIDAPELGQTCRIDGRAYDCGREARAALQQLVRNPDLACEGWERDRFDRLLVRCTAGGRDVNAAMVEAGWAVAYGDYERMEDDARRNRRGLWAGSFEEPREWRRQKALNAEPRHGALTRGINIWRKLFDKGGDAGETL